MVIGSCCSYHTKTTTKMNFTPHLPQEHLRDVLVEAPDPVPLQRDGALAVLPADADGGLHHPKRLWKIRKIFITSFFKGQAHVEPSNSLGETVDEERLGKKYFTLPVEFCKKNKNKKTLSWDIFCWKME